MNASREIITALIAGGMDALDAAELMARAAVEMTAGTKQRTSGALRQEKYRRNKASQCDACDGTDETSQNVIKRNEVTLCDNASLSIDKEKKEKKEKKERVRASQMTERWRPSPDHWDAAVKALGSIERAEKELRKFANNAAAKGMTYKKWDAAWDNWVTRAIEWSPEKPAPMAPQPGDPRLSIEEAVAQFAKLGRWSRHAPVNDISQAPPELLAKYRLLPDGRRIQ